MAADAVSSDRQSDTEDEDEGLAQQSTDIDMLDPSVNQLHHETNGHTDPSVEAHQSSDASEEDSEDEEDDAGNELGNKVCFFSSCDLSVMHVKFSSYSCLTAAHCI